jgi:hypothetical protein
MSAPKAGPDTEGAQYKRLYLLLLVRSLASVFSTHLVLVRSQLACIWYLHVQFPACIWYLHVHSFQHAYDTCTFTVFNIRVHMILVRSQFSAYIWYLYVHSFQYAYDTCTFTVFSMHMILVRSQFSAYIWYLHVHSFQYAYDTCRLAHLSFLLFLHMHYSRLSKDSPSW